MFHTDNIYVFTVTIASVINDLPDHKYYYHLKKKLVRSYKIFSKITSVYSEKLPNL